MTESDWLSSQDPVAMLRWLHGNPLDRGASLPPSVENRKLRLFACACCRQVWDGQTCSECGGLGGYILIAGEARTGPANAMSYADYLAGAKDPWRQETATDWVECSCNNTGRVGGLTDPRSRRAVEVAERFADGEATEEDRVQAWQDSLIAHQGSGEPLLLSAADTCNSNNQLPSVLRWFQQTTAPRINLPGIVQATLLRDIVGNPFQPSLSHADLARRGVLDWNGSTIPRLAQLIYVSRNFADLSILADALEEAGCTDAAILDHCRSPGPHARGCHVLDALLGKSRPV